MLKLNVTEALDIDLGRNFTDKDSPILPLVNSVILPDMPVQLPCHWKPLPAAQKATCHQQQGTDQPPAHPHKQTGMKGAERGVEWGEDELSQQPPDPKPPS